MPADPLDAPDKIGDLAAEAGIRRVQVVAWRDLDDVEAGGSELHAARVCAAWADAGIEVRCRTSHAPGHPPELVRDGYAVERRAGRYLVFPRAAASLVSRRTPRPDALVEIWNGMPFLSPLWFRGPRLTFLHHVHGAMWHMVLPPRLAAAGDLLERRLAPPLYRRSSVVTLSESSRSEIVSQLGLRPERVSVVPPGVDDRFHTTTPPQSVPRSPTPSLLAVGRLVPAKRFDALIRAAVAVRAAVPGTELTIVGEGYERQTLERLVDELDARSFVHLPGRLSDAELVAHYRTAWLLVATSSHEGWGMSITEAAAAGTPAIATAIAGHRDAVVDGETGTLVPDVDATLVEAFAGAVVDLLRDDPRREAWGRAAADRASRFTWEATATALMRLLVADAERRSGRDWPSGSDGRGRS